MASRRRRSAHEGRPAAEDTTVLPQPLGEVLDFMQQLWTLDHALLTRSKWMEAAIGITGPQRLVVRLIADSPGISAGMLSSVLKFHPSTITGILRRMQAAGFVRRSSDLEDRRRVLVNLTPRGQAVNKRKAGTVEDAVARALRKVSAQDVAATRRVLAAITVELERGMKQPVAQARPRRE